MNDASSTPVVLLAFANDQDAYLQMIVRERKAIAKALQEYDDRRYIKVVKEENTSVKDVFDLCTRYADRVAVFHYGGHADGTQLQLEAGGRAEMAHAAGLAQLLGQQQSLQLVFLNGCATLEQVRTLFDAGVRAVIATAVPINDEVATSFAEQFYQSLGGGATIRRAFDTARAFVTTRFGTAKEIGEFRAVGGASQAASGRPSVPWGLYVNPQAKGDEALTWTLPQVAEHQVVIRGAVTSTTVAAPVNTVLTKILLEQVSANGLTLQVKDEDGDVDERLIRAGIMDSFPTPVGEQIRNLFEHDVADMQRLQQLLVTYEVTVQFACFALLSQLWNARVASPAMVISGDDAAEIGGFLALSGDQQPMFDYVKVIAAAGRVLQQHAIPPFLAELPRLMDALQEDAFSAAHRFLEATRAEMARGSVGNDAVSAYCAQGEAHLGTIMAALSFLVRYKLGTVKNIDMRKERNKPPQYVHRIVKLTRISAPTMDQPEVFAGFTDTASVILLRSFKKLADYLNLSPFVIDENALATPPEDKSKLFFYSHHDAASDSYHFRFVSDRDQLLAISGSTYPNVKAQFDEFREAMSSR